MVQNAAKCNIGDQIDGEKCNIGEQGGVEMSRKVPLCPIQDENHGKKWDIKHPAGVAKCDVTRGTNQTHGERCALVKICVAASETGALAAMSV